MEEDIVNIGEARVDLSKVTKDVRGVRDIAIAALEDQGEKWILQMKPKLNILAQAHDIYEWDKPMLDRYKPVYTDIQQPPEGEDVEEYQARLSLQTAVRGLAPTISTTRDLLDFTLKEFGDQKELNFGMSINYNMVNTEMLTGLSPTNLAEVDRALSYAEQQLSELTTAAYFGRGTVAEFEEMTLHAGSVLFLAMELAELIKTCYYDFTNAGNKPMTEMENYPEPKTLAGLGSVDKNKKVIAFTGNDFLPAWCAVNYIKEKGLEDEIEVCGTGPAAHDLIRFYERGKILASRVNTIKAIRSGILDVIVASDSSLSEDIPAEAEKVEARVIATNYKRSFGLQDKTGEPIEGIISSILGGLPGVLVTDPRKVGRLAVELVQKLKRDYAPSEQEIKEMEKDKFRIRAGRGPSSHLELRDTTFGLVLSGNGPGMAYVLGDGDYPGHEGEVAWMVKDFLDRNCIVGVITDGALDAGRYFDEVEKQFLFEKYPSLTGLRCLINPGGWTAISHPVAFSYKGCQLSTNLSARANFTQIVDWTFNRLGGAIIMWNADTDDWYTVAAGLVRAGFPVILGPSGFKFKRYLMANKYDRDKWWMYDGVSGEKKEVDPGPVHMIVPVETKEEAVAMAMRLFARPLALRDPRLSSLDNYLDAFERFFGEYPDDWHLYVRSEQEIHMFKRVKMLRILEKEQGWEIEGARVKRARHRDGTLMDMSEYTDTYGVQQGRYSTLISRLILPGGKKWE